MCKYLWTELGQCGLQITAENRNKTKPQKKWNYKKERTKMLFGQGLLVNSRHKHTNTQLVETISYVTFRENHNCVTSSNL